MCSGFFFFLAMSFVSVLGHFSLIKMSQQIFLPLFNFGIDCAELVLYLSLSWQNSSMEISGPRVFFWGHL